MKTIQKKIWPEYFRAMKAGAKKAEIRLADFRVRPGDAMVFREWDPKKRAYTGRTIRKVVRSAVHVPLATFYRMPEVKKRGLSLIEFR